MALCTGPYARGTPVETLLGGTHPCYPGVHQWALVRPDQRWLAARYRMTRGASGHDAHHPWSWYMGCKHAVGCGSYGVGALAAWVTSAAARSRCARSLAWRCAGYTVGFAPGNC